MRIVLTLSLFAALFLCGCESTPWVRGSFDVGMPKLAEKFSSGAKFHVEKTEPRVRRAFESALVSRGFTVVNAAKKSDAVVCVAIDSWEYNDIGFGGSAAPRDDMELSVTIFDSQKKRVLMRAKISVRSDFRIIERYVNEL